MLWGGAVCRPRICVREREGEREWQYVFSKHAMVLKHQKLVFSSIVFLKIILKPDTPKPETKMPIKGSRPSLCDAKPRLLPLPSHPSPTRALNGALGERGGRIYSSHFTKNSYLSFRFEKVHFSNEPKVQRAALGRDAGKRWR